MELTRTESNGASYAGNNSKRQKDQLVNSATNKSRLCHDTNSVTETELERTHRQNRGLHLAVNIIDCKRVRTIRDTVYDSAIFFLNAM